MAKYIFIKDYTTYGSPGVGAPPGERKMDFKKGDVVDGTVRDDTPVDGGKYLNFKKGDANYSIVLQHGSMVGPVDSPLREYNSQPIAIIHGGPGVVGFSITTKTIIVIVAAIIIYKLFKKYA